MKKYFIYLFLLNLCAMPQGGRQRAKKSGHLRILNETIAEMIDRKKLEGMMAPAIDLPQGLDLPAEMAQQCIYLLGFDQFGKLQDVDSEEAAKHPFVIVTILGPIEQVERLEERICIVELYTHKTKFSSCLKSLKRMWNKRPDANKEHLMLINAIENVTIAVAAEAPSDWKFIALYNGRYKLYATPQGQLRFVSDQGQFSNGTLKIEQSVIYDESEIDMCRGILQAIRQI